LHHEKIEQAKTRMTANTAALLAGHAVLLTLFGSLWLYLPAPGDRAPRWAGTPLENYVLAAYCVGFAMVLALLTGDTSIISVEKVQEKSRDLGGKHMRQRRIGSNCPRDWNIGHNPFAT
jgi:hypothetical protein